MNRVYTMLFCITCVFSSVWAQQDNPSLQTCHIRFRAKVNDSLLSFDSTYQNHFGEAFKVRSFKYYISHVELMYKDGSLFYLPVKPRLINEADSTSKDLSFTAPKGIIASIQFLLGIDSITNTTGVQTDDLDPAKGMFWIWNTGYIMAKLEGSSPASKAPGKQYSYDIGGYKSGENAARQIHLSLTSTNKNQSSTFIVTADISKWFYGKNNIRIREQPMCHSPGAFAMQVAGNYADMFSISVQ